MTLTDFILTYLDNNPANLGDLLLNCAKCPLREVCGDAAEKGDDRNCSQFLADNLES